MSERRTSLDTYEYILGRKIHCRIEGSGPPIVLIHGLDGSIEEWDPVIRALRDKYTVYAFEFPGFGLSESFKPRELNMLFPVVFMEECRQVFNIEKPIIVGVSLGGLFALEYALYRQRNVEKLVLVDSAGLGREINWTWRLASLPFGDYVVRAIKPDEWAPNDWKWRIAALPIIGRKLAKVRSQITQQQEMARKITEGNKRNAWKLLRYGVNIFGQKPTINRLPELKQRRDSKYGVFEVPTLIIWGKNDDIFPVEQAARAAKIIPNAVEPKILNAGHTPHQDAPEQFISTLLEFIEY